MESLEHCHLRIGGGFYRGSKNACPYCMERRKRLWRTIIGFLGKQTGSWVREDNLRSNLQRKNWTNQEITQALAEAGELRICNSCHCIISRWNPHREPCPHSSVVTDS